MRWRMIFFSSASNASCAAWRVLGVVGARRPAPEYFSSTSASTAFVASWRSSLSVDGGRLVELLAVRLGDLLDQVLVGLRDLDLQLGLAGLLLQLDLRGAQLLDRGMRDVQRVEDLGLGHLVGAALDHQHGLVGTSDDEIHVGGEELLLGRVDDEVAVDLADAHGADGRRVRNVGDHQRGGRAVHRQDVVRVDLVHGEREVDQLRLTPPALREERTQRAVDHAGDQRRLLAGAALALEERAGDLARGVHALLDIHRQREEVDVAEISGGRRGQHDGVACRDRHGAGGLLGHLARLEGDLGPADFDGDPVHFRHMSLSCARLGSRRGPLHRLDASVVVDRHVSRRFRSERRRVACAAMATTDRRLRRDGLHRDG